MITKTNVLPDTKVLKSEVVNVIVKNLGITKSAFFFRETMSQKTDYLEIKKRLFGNKTARELYKEIINRKHKK